MSAQGRLTEAELDEQLAQLRREIGALEEEKFAAERARAERAGVRERLRDAESFLEEISRRLRELTREEMAAIVRRAVARVVVRPRADGCKVVSATYRFAPPVILGTDPLPESP